MKPSENRSYLISIGPEALASFMIGVHPSGAMMAYRNATA
jgi:hypothetical protein